MSSEHRDVASFEAMRRACMDTSDASLAAYFALCAFQLGSESQRESIGMRSAMERALDGAIAHKNRGLAEFLFDQFSDYLSTISVKQYVRDLHMLTADALEEMGVDSQQLFSLSDLLDQMGDEASSALIRLPHPNTNAANLFGGDAQSVDGADESGSAMDDVAHAANVTDIDADVNIDDSYDVDFDIDDEIAVNTDDADADADTNAETDADAETDTASEATDAATDGTRNATTSTDTPASSDADAPVLTGTDAESPDDSLVSRRFPINAATRSTPASSAPDTPVSSTPAARAQLQPPFLKPFAPPRKPRRADHDEELYDNQLHMILADQNTVGKLVGFDSLIDDLHSCGVNPAGSVSSAFIKRLQSFHGMKRAPLCEPLMLEINDPFEADLLVNALVHEIDKPTLRISSQFMPEGFQALALSSDTFSRLQVRSMLVTSSFSGCLVLENVDQWDANPSDMLARDPRERHAWESAFRDVLNLIVGAMHNDQTSVILTAENIAGIDPELLELVQPFEVLHIDMPSSSERHAIWEYLQSKHHSLRHLDCALLTRLTKGLSRGALYLSTDVALREAYDFSLRTQKIHAVSLLNILEKLSFCFEDGCPEQLAMRSVIMREFSNDISSVESAMNMNAKHLVAGSSAMHANAEQCESNAADTVTENVPSTSTNISHDDESGDKPSL